MRTLNTRARDFALRYLFLAEPDDGYPVVSMSLAGLATEFCAKDGCDSPVNACRRHSQAVVLGVAKMIADGDALAELSRRGVLFVRLSAAGVMSPMMWTHTPKWWFERPQLVQWARSS